MVCLDFPAFIPVPPFRAPPGLEFLELIFPCPFHAGLWRSLCVNLPAVKVRWAWKFYLALCFSALEDFISWPVPCAFRKPALMELVLHRQWAFWHCFKGFSCAANSKESHFCALEHLLCFPFTSLFWVVSLPSCKFNYDGKETSIKLLQNL